MERHLYISHLELWRDIYTYDTEETDSLNKCFPCTYHMLGAVLACGDAVIDRLHRPVLDLAQHMDHIHCAQMLLNK